MKITIYLLSFLIALGCVFTWHLDRIADDPGVGWHLKTGEYVATHGAPPLVDPFLEREAPLPWISDQWLGDYFLFQVYDLLDWPGLYAFCVLLFFLPYYGVLHVTAYRLLRGRFAGSMSVPRLFFASVSTALAAYFCSKLGLVHLIVRPVLFGYALFAILYGVLFRFYVLLVRRDDQAAALRYLQKHLVLLPLLFLLWANLHPSFVVGLFLIALLTASLITEKFLFKRRFSARVSNGLVLLGVLCGAVTLLNPYGFSLHASIFTLAGSDFFMSLNSEWHSLGFRHLEGTLFELIFGGVFIALLVVRRDRLKWGVFEAALILVFAHLSLERVRMLPFFAIVMLPLLAEAFYALFHEIFCGSFRNEAKEHVSISYKRYTRSAFLVVCIALFSLAAFRNTVGWYKGPFGPSKKKYPFEALSYLNAQPGEKRVYATPNWGGFLTFYGKNKTAPLIDDRNTMLGEQVYKDYFDVEKLSPRSDKVLGALGTTHLLLYKDSPLARKYRQEEKLAFEGDVGVVVRYE